MNVAVIGCGVRGSVAAALLAGAGVEELSLVDGALIDEGDIGTSPLVFTPDLHAGKANALVAKIGLINPAVLAMPFPAHLDADNAEAILAGADVVIDCVGEEAISSAIAAAAAAGEIELVAAPADYSPATATPAEAVATGAAQAESALEQRN